MRDETEIGAFAFDVGHAEWDDEFAAGQFVV